MSGAPRTLERRGVVVGLSSVLVLALVFLVGFWVVANMQAAADLSLWVESASGDTSSDPIVLDAQELRREAPALARALDEAIGNSFSVVEPDAEATQGIEYLRRLAGSDGREFDVLYRDTLFHVVLARDVP